MGDVETLYVWKKNNEQFMVSKNAIDGYVKYTKTGDGCWIPDDGVVATSESEGVKTSEESSEGVNKGTANKGTANETTSIKQVKTSKELDITTVNCNSNYNPSDINNMPNMTSLTKVLSDLKNALTGAHPINTTALFTEELVRHINIRFTHLECLLTQTSDLHVVIAGVAKTGDVEGHHNLGTGLAVEQWGVGTVDNTGKGTLNNGYNTTPKGQCYDIVQTLINMWCRKLMTTYKRRVTYGIVGFNIMSNKIINVWGANLSNYKESNKKGGGGQADNVKDPNLDEGNAAGAFGIITTPLGIKGWDTNFTEKSSPFNNADLIKASFTGSVKGGNKSKTKKRRN